MMRVHLCICTHCLQIYVSCTTLVPIAYTAVCAPGCTQITALKAAQAAAPVDNSAEIARLEAAKKAAIAEEDFDKAREMKIQVVFKMA